MLRIFATETFKEISFDGKLQLRYAISNYGRLVSFTNKPEDGRIVKGSLINGYRIFRYKIRDADNKIKHRHFFYYKLVAEYFLPKTSDEQVFVLHLDRFRANDYVANLKWATKPEMLAHSKASPYVIEAKKKLIQHRINSDGTKLTETQVMWLKKKLLDPNRRILLKSLAKQFGVSLMTLHRIRTGENWGHIKVKQ
jgi:NUMOD4 motif